MHYYGVDEVIVKIWVITFDSHVFCDYLNYLKLNPDTCIVFFFPLVCFEFEVHVMFLFVCFESCKSTHFPTLINSFLKKILL